MTETALIDYDFGDSPPAIVEKSRQIGDLMIQGATLTRACRQLGIMKDTVYQWQFRHAEIRQYFGRIDELWAHAKADELAELAESGLNAQIMRTHADNLKWLMARKARRHYGDEAAKQSTADNVALIDVLREAVQRIPRPSDDAMKVINNEPVDNTRQLPDAIIDEQSNDNQ